MSLSRFAKLLGLPTHQAEDALHSERAARAVLSRRSFFAAGGALAAGTAFSFGRQVDAKPKYGEPGYDPTGSHSPTGPIGITGPAGVTGTCRIYGVSHSWADIQIHLHGKLVLPVTEIRCI